MREPKRIKRILKTIEQLWMQSPDERFGQFLINRCVIPDDVRIWIMEDDEMEDILNKWGAKNGKTKKAKKANKKV